MNMRRRFTPVPESAGEQAPSSAAAVLDVPPGPVPGATLRILRDPDEVAAAIARAAEWESRHVPPVEGRVARYRNAVPHV